ncbi:MAG: hypothetical protein R2864_14360 [Syntrophotaleaceae bacterium]
MTSCLFTHDLAEAVSGREMLLLVRLSQVLRQVLQQAEPHIAADTLLVSAAKGIENSTLSIMSEIIEEVLPAEKCRRVVYLSGRPSPERWRPRYRLR